MFNKYITLSNLYKYKYNILNNKLLNINIDFNNKLKYSLIRTFSLGLSDPSHHASVNIKSTDKDKLKINEIKIESDLNESILITERYHGRKHIYKSNNGDLVYIIESKSSNYFQSSYIASFFKSLFLPIGYPQSVHPSYFSHHMWLFAESFFAAIYFVLSSESMLDSLGLGSAAAAGTAVAIQWVLKDGLGEIGKLFLTSGFSKYFDSKPKASKLIGETMVIIGYGCMMLCAFFPKYFLLLASVGNGFRIASFMIWGATSSHFFRHLSNNQNIGDIISKYESQSVISGILGCTVGIGLIYFNTSPTFILTTYLAIIPLYLTSTYYSAKVLNFPILNEGKLCKLVNLWLDNKPIVSPDELQKTEKLFGEFDSTGVKVGGSISNYKNSIILKSTLELFNNESYLLLYQSDCIIIILHDEANEKAVIKALFHSTKMFHLIRSMKEVSNNKAALSTISNEDFFIIAKSLMPTIDFEYERFLIDLKSAGWKTNTIAWVDDDIRSFWTINKTSSNNLEKPKDL